MLREFKNQPILEIGVRGIVRTELAPGVASCTLRHVERRAHAQDMSRGALVQADEAEAVDRRAAQIEVPSHRGAWPSIGGIRSKAGMSLDKKKPLDKKLRRAGGGISSKPENSASRSSTGELR